MRKLFVGFALIFFHFTINGFDLLPDFVGYICVVGGLLGLINESDYFGRAKPWSVAMIFLSAISAFGGLYDTIEIGFAFYLLGLFETLIMLHIIRMIDQGIGELEQRKECDLGSDVLLRIWKVQTICSFACAVLAWSMDETLSMIALLMGVIAIVAHIVFLLYLHKAEVVYKAVSKTGGEIEGF